MEKKIKLGNFGGYYGTSIDRKLKKFNKKYKCYISIYSIWDEETFLKVSGNEKRINIFLKKENGYLRQLYKQIVTTSIASDNKETASNFRQILNKE